MAKVKSNMSTLYTFAGVRFMPGVNNVDDKKMGEMEKVKAFKHKFDVGLLEKLQGKNITAKDVAEMYDRGELQRLAQEGTKAQKEAAQKRLDELFPTEKEGE